VSCCLGCPYEGKVDAKAVRDVVIKLLEMGCYEVSLGDTVGVGCPGDVTHLLDTLLIDNTIDKNQLAVHFHDTYGTALTNVYVALQRGISVVDTSVSGLGG